MAADGRQQQDQPPSRHRAAFPSPQPYQPRRLRQQEPAQDRQLPPPTEQRRQPGSGSSIAAGRGIRSGVHGRDAGRGARPHPDSGTAGTSRQQPARPVGCQAATTSAATVTVPPLRVAALVGAASDSQQPAAARVAALHQLHQRLFDPAAQREALQQLQIIWPRLLALLWGDPAPAVGAAAAPVVGAIGALAAQAAAAAAATKAASQNTTAAAAATSDSLCGGLLFDWLLPVLQRRASPNGQPLAPHQLVAVLAALRDCLTGVDGVTLARYANAVFGACQALLEGEATPPVALPPLLAVLQQAARHQHALKPRFRDLVDLLLGWALEPVLPEAARPGLSRVLAAFGAQWWQQPAFTASLLGSLLDDMQRLLCKTAAESVAPARASEGGDGTFQCDSSPCGLRQVLALAACALPILDAAAAVHLPACQQHLLRLLGIFKQLVAAEAGSPTVTPAVVVELAGHVARLSALAPAAAGATDAGLASLQPGGKNGPSQGTEGQHVTAQLISSLGGLGVRDRQQQEPPAAEVAAAAVEHVHLKLRYGPLQAADEQAMAAAAEAAAQQCTSLQQLFQSVAAFAAEAASQTCVLAQQAAVLALLAAVRSWVQMLVQQQQSHQVEGPPPQPALLEAAAAMLLPLLPAPGQPGSRSEGGTWLLALRAYGSREVVLQAAQLLVPLVQHSSSALETVLADTEAHAAAMSSAEELQQANQGQKQELSGKEVPAEDTAALLLFNMQLLQTAAPQLTADGLFMLWWRLLPLARPDSALAAITWPEQQQPHGLWQQLLGLLEAAVQHLVGGKQRMSAAADPAALAAVAYDAVLLLCSILTAGCSSGSAVPESVLLPTLCWLQQAAAWRAEDQEQQTEVKEPGSSNSAAMALKAGLPCTALPLAPVRAAALCTVCAWACSSWGSRVLLQDASLAAALYHASLLHLSDFHLAAASAAQELLLAAAAPLILNGTLASPGSTNSCSDSMPAMAAVAFQAQQLVFRPSQLRQLLDYLTAGAAALTTVLSAGRQDAAAPVRHWLPRMLQSAQASSPNSQQHWCMPCCLSQAAWWAVQEAAKQCVSARLHTHYGGPTQTLAALERAVQAAAADLRQQQHAEDTRREEEVAGGGDSPASAGSTSGGGGVEKQQVTVLLLLFLHALEQTISAASSGSSSRAATSQSTAAFFGANKKVCQAWFARVRPLLLRMAAAAHMHELATYHVLQWLRDLQQQLQVLMPAASASSSQKEVEEAAVAALSPVLSPAASAGLPPKTPLAGGKQQRMPGGECASLAANPAAALLAATRGSPDMALRQQQAQPGVTPASKSSRRLSQQQLQGAAAKVAEAAAAAAAALCALGDAEGVAGLQAFCRSAFEALLQQVPQAAAGNSAASSPPESAAAAWDWLEAVQHQAAGRYEAAIKQYCHLYASTPGAAAPSMQCVPTGSLARLVAEAYAAVGDMSGLRLWLETKPGSRLSAVAASRCRQLASWEQLPEQHQAAGSNASDSSPLQQELLLRLQLGSLDPAAATSAAPEGAAACLAKLAAETVGENQLQQRLHMQRQLPAWLLLETVAAGEQHLAQQFSAWQLPQPGTASSAATPAAGHSLQPLLLLTGNAALSMPQQAMVLLAAAREAARGGNVACTLQLLERAEARQRELDNWASETDDSFEAATILLRLQRLQLPAAQGGSSAQAWRLLHDAASSSVAAAVIPAAAQLLLAKHKPDVGIPTPEIAAVVRGTKLASQTNDSRFALFEQQLLEAVQQRRASAAAIAVQYAALKAAVAAVPNSAHQWWQFAAWLHQLAQQQHGAQVTAAQAAFSSSCKALSLASASSLSSTSYDTMPLLLQVLQMLTEHGSGCLPADASAQLAAVPAAAWLPVVPHLLAQLADGAPNSSSRGSQTQQQQLLQGLLLHVADAAPCQVLLPTMVATMAQPSAGATQQQHPEVILPHLLSELEQQHVLLARQLQVLMTEAARLAVLPEEHWHTVLQEAAATAAKRLHMQQKQPTAEAAGSSAGADSYLAAMAPVLLCLQQQLAAAEAAAPETPHERRFQQQQLPRLRLLLQQLTGPLLEPETGAAAEDKGDNSSAAASPAGQQRQKAMSLLRSAANDLAAALRSKQLQLAEVSPALAELADTGIPMPGVEAAPDGTAVTVAGVFGDVAVLSTKTRPKRLWFAGSDGMQHSFLLKGREDMRADARLVQLLRAGRSALHAGGSGPGSMAAVQCFEVVPLGSRLGLVQWVEDTVPLYEVYTSWQQHHMQQQRFLAAAAAAHQQQKAATAAPLMVTKAAQAGKAAARPGWIAMPPGHMAAKTLSMPARLRPQHMAVQQVQQRMRPIDQFYAKLKEAGIDPASSRDAWPQAKLIGVLESMQQTVDRQLLWREVWLGSSGAADWWQRQRRFVESAAAMSVVGHLLGLGDRHLDNMLLHRGAAQLVHIDFSVVFDRGLQLKVPEVVPFRLTQTLMAALGIAGVEGAFRLSCERVLGALRANSLTLCALLDAALRDSGVDWDSEAAAKASSKAFGQAVALQLFALRRASATKLLASTVQAAGASLAATIAALADYVRQFLGVSGTAAAAAESHALLQRCQATLGSAAAQEQQLMAQAEEGQAALTAVLAEAQPLAAQVLASLQECQAWQQRHDALLPLLLNNPPAALLAGPAVVDPAAEATNSGTALLLVSSPTGLSSGEGSGSIVHAVLGMLPAHTPLSAGLLLQAAATDKQGQRLLQERAAAAQQLVAALQQYAVAVACLLGGPSYSDSSQHAHWLAAFQAAMGLPVPQGFQRATKLAPRRPDTANVLAGWRTLAAAVATAAGLAEQLSDTAAALQLERVDVALAASDAQQRMLDSAVGCWVAEAASAAAGAGTGAGEQRHGELQGPAALALAFAAFSDAQAAVVQQLAAEQQQCQMLEEEEEEEEEEEAAPEEATSLLAAVERLVLGYASTAVALRDATSEELFLAVDGSNLLAWLSQAVQAADSLSTAAAELQLLLPQLLALLCSPLGAGQVSVAVAAAADALEEEEATARAAQTAAEQQQHTAAEASVAEEQAASAMQALLAAAGQHCAFAGLLHGLQQLQAAAQLLLPAREQPTLAQQQLLLAGAVVATWQELEDAVEEAATGSSSEEPATAERGGSVPWRRCSTVLAEAVAAELAQHLLPPLAAALSSTAATLRAAAPSLARRAGLEAVAAPPLPILPGGSKARAPPLAGRPDLAPFTDFDNGELPGASMLLGSLLTEELEPAGRSQLGAELEGRHPGEGSSGGAAISEPGLIPFLDFDESLAGADDLLEALQPVGGTEFEGLEGHAVLSHLSEGEAAEGDVASLGAAGWLQLAALLQAAAEAAGALAAMDAAQYIGGLALQQCQQAMQQHCVELAAFQWVNEHVLPPEATAAAALLPGTPVSVAVALAAGAVLPPMHPAVAAWTLHGSRRQVLQQLQSGAGTLLSLGAPLQQWQAQLAAVQQQVAGEVAAAVPYAVAKLHQGLQRQQHWLQAATAHVANLLDVSQAVLQFEAARTADAQLLVVPDTMAEPLLPQPAADRYQAEQREGWCRYTDLLQHMQRLHGIYAAAQRRLVLAASELEQLQMRRNEATSIMESAEAAFSNAATSFAAAALPLIRATQQLPTAVAQLLPNLDGCINWAQLLRQTQRQVVELAAADAMPTCGTAAVDASEQLAAAAACLQQLPTAVHALQAALLPVRNKMLGGGRGEAAAKQQAAEVVDALSTAVTELQPLLDKAGKVQHWLAALPPSLHSLAARAAGQAAALQQQHGFSLHGLEQLLQGQAGTVAAQAVLPTAGGRALTGSLMLATGAPLQAKQEEQRQYAASVLQCFTSKLLGQRHHTAATAQGGAHSATVVDVPEQVQHLIAAATAPGNLARMYEGWMPWV